MIRRFALLLLLCAASLPLAAREVRQAGANGDGGCPTALAEEDTAAGEQRGNPRGATPPAAKEQTPSPAAGGNTENSIRAPRWHSFLPGMFR